MAVAKRGEISSEPLGVGQSKEYVKDRNVKYITLNRACALGKLEPSL